MRPRAAVVPVFLLTLAALSGCLAATTGPTQPPECQVVPYELFTLPLPGEDEAPGDPDRTWDALVRATDADGVNVFVPPWAGDDPNAEAADVTLEPLGDEGDLIRVRAAPPGEADQLRVDVRWSDGDPCGRQGDASWHLAPEAGEVASPGQGVHAFTAGFWENGTLFYTNMQSVHDSDWPRAGWYAWGGADPLPVYVYDEDPSERPAYWGVSAQDPVLGQSVMAWEYFVTIEGFNEGLKDLSTSTSRVVHLAPEEAYTRPGNEDHPLYGDALIFYIEIVDVVDRPCWSPHTGDMLCPVVG